jgi:hypothetical protein
VLFPKRQRLGERLLTDFVPRVRCLFEALCRALQLIARNRFMRHRRLHDENEQQQQQQQQQQNDAL